MTNMEWAVTSLGAIVDIASDIFKEDVDELVTRAIRVPRERLTTWGVAILAISLAVMYQLVPLAHASQPVIRTARRWLRPLAGLRA